ncbi:MAG: dihydroxyacetone kinase subunit DhaL [Methyloprofundus sp.]|nr:dihydroxyacetone kinase subunit DhaL [Methyloprofundus sp.]
MKINPDILPELIQAVSHTITEHSEEVTELDKAIGDGDHVINLQRGLHALLEQQAELAQLDWASAWQKMGLTCMSKIGGAAGSLIGSLFVTMAKTAKDKPVDSAGFAEAFLAGVESIKLRGRSNVGEKTMLDVLLPVAQQLQAQAANVEFSVLLQQLNNTAIKGMESTRDMLATKGRASYLGERSIGHIDAGAKTSQLMICAIIDILQSK